MTDSGESSQAPTRRTRVVVVDDDPLVLAVTRRVLARRGFEAVCCDHARLALCEALREVPHAVVADLHMPDVNGVTFLRLLQGLLPDTLRIMYTGDVQYGSADLPKPPPWIDAVVTKSEGYAQLPAALEGGRRGVADAGIEARTLALSLVSALAVPKVETLEHALRLSHGALRLGALAGLKDDALSALELGAILHDVGMMQLPESLLTSPHALTASEWQAIQRHPEFGANAVEHSPQLRCAARVIRHHHERFDGRGYPGRLAGEAIPLEARLLAVVDTFDALTRDRPHALARSEATARTMLAELRGTQFDPYAVDVFMSVPAEEWRRPPTLVRGSSLA